MENHALVSGGPLDNTQIDDGAYTLSLAREGVKAGLIGESVLAQMQDGLLALLRTQIEELTRGESSSIPTEAADELMDGIGYCIDTALRSASIPQESLALLREKSVAGLYQLGSDLLNADASACERLLSRVRATRTKTVNEGYAILLDQTFPSFIQAWKSSRHPYDFSVITEYPLAVEERGSGIPSVRARLESLALENRFCGRFSGGLDALLRGYARQNRTSPEEAYVNLFTIALQNLLFNRLLGQDGLALSPEDYSKLSARLAALTAEERAAAILQSAEQLINDCAFENDKLDDYIRTVTKQFIALLNFAEGNPAQLAVVDREAKLTFEEGERLDTEAFKLVAEEILLSDNARRKAAIIREELRSFDDLCELLGANCIFEEEFDIVFASFDDAVNALLLTRVLSDREDSSATHGETEWRQRFLIFFGTLPSGRQKNIRVLSDELLRSSN